MQECDFNFYGLQVSFRTSCAGLMDRVEKDFEYFRVGQNDIEIKDRLSITAMLQEPPLDRVTHRFRRRRTKNAIMFTRGRIRHNDYYGRGFVSFDFEKNSGEVFGTNLNRLHEITYLCILSRVGKFLDLIGYHRIHAMGVTYGDAAGILSMPSKGGKTTLFLKVLEDKNISILSDDSPIVTRDLRVLPFPIRVGVETDSLKSLNLHEEIDLKQSYEIERWKYGKKTLIPISSFKNLPNRESVFYRTVVLSGKRDSEGQPKVRLSYLSFLPMITGGLVIGVGLPMMREYFIEDSVGDYFKLGKILVSRIRTAIALLRNAKKNTIVLGTNHEMNKAMFISLLNGVKNRANC